MGTGLDTSSDRELMYALTAAVRDLQKAHGPRPGEAETVLFFRGISGGAAAEGPTSSTWAY